MIAETLSPPDTQDTQEKDETNMSALARKFQQSNQPEKTVISTEPGTKLMKVHGMSAYMQIPTHSPKYEQGKTYNIELAPGERLHKFESTNTETYEGNSYELLLLEIDEKNKESRIIDMQPVTSETGKIAMQVTTKAINYIVQPSDNPNLNRTGAGNLLGGVSPLWVYKLLQRGPCHPNGGLTGYVMDKTGKGWIPRRQGEPNHGAEIYLYEKDVREYMAAYVNESEEEQHVEVPEPLRKLLVKFASPEIEKVGFVTMTRVWSEAKHYTSYLSEAELKKVGLRKKLTDRDYAYLKAVSASENWKANPRKSQSAATNSYRRNYRILEEID